MTPASPTSSTGSRFPRRDTGFPEPFCGDRNTTLPHPEADLSPNASLSSDDIDVERMISRTRRTILAKKSRVLSRGVITPEMEAMYSNSALVDSDSAIPSTSTPPTRSQSHPAATTTPNPRPTSASGTTEDRPSNDDVLYRPMRDSTDSGSVKRKAVLKMFHLHR